MHKLAECQRNGLVRGGVEGRHLVHNTLGVVPVSDSEQRFQQTKLLVIRWLCAEERASDCILLNMPKFSEQSSAVTLQSDAF